MLESHIVLPEIVYNGLVCALSTAAAWHFVTLLSSLRKRLRGAESRSDRERS